jgi:hypothetical protein
MEPLAANVSMTASTRASMGGTMSATMAMSSPASMASMPTSSGLMNSTGMAAQMAAHFGPAAAAALAFALGRGDSSQVVGYREAFLCLEEPFP